jgi:hypothetical protein
LDLNKNKTQIIGLNPRCRPYPFDQPATALEDSLSFFFWHGSKRLLAVIFGSAPISCGIPGVFYYLTAVLLHFNQNSQISMLQHRRRPS